MRPPLELRRNRVSGAVTCVCAWAKRMEHSHRFHAYRIFRLPKILSVCAGSALRSSPTSDIAEQSYLGSGTPDIGWTNWPELLATAIKTIDRGKKPFRPGRIKNFTERKNSYHLASFYSPDLWKAGLLRVAERVARFHRDCSGMMGTNFASPSKVRFSAWTTSFFIRDRMKLKEREDETDHLVKHKKTEKFAAHLSRKLF